ncbi:MAG: hypothetical protein LBV69_04975 [Bacteroidales bacterium]|jgi:MraZ protein|nr:hypothetical protein [Bacteroidales bacterium]
MFVGEYIGKVDEKGRIVMPFQLLRQLPEEQQKESFVIKKDIYENCLLLFPINEWNNQTSILKKRLNPFNKKHDKFLKEYYRGTAEIILDKSNRILIPKRLLEYLKNSNDLIFAAQEGKIAIWAKDVYEKQALNDQEFAELAEEILGGDFGFNKE